MPRFNISLMSSADLQALRMDIDQELIRRESKLQAIDEIRRLAHEKGLKIEDLITELGGGKSRAKKEVVAAVVRFRHPDKPDQTWSGRGKRPKWLNEAIQAGRTLEDLKV